VIEEKFSLMRTIATEFMDADRFAMSLLSIAIAGRYHCHPLLS